MRIDVQVVFLPGRVLVKIRVSIKREDRGMGWSVYFTLFY